MPILRITAQGTNCRLHASPQAVTSSLRQADFGDDPVIIMIHGFGYMPGDRVNCPHCHILALYSKPAKQTITWPNQLGFGNGEAHEGLGIAFGWCARGGLVRARRRAVAAGRALSALVTGLYHRAPHRPVHLVAHSLGVEVAAEALHHLPPESVGRVIAMTGACFQSRITRALATPAGQCAEFINVTSRENDLFDFLFERIIGPDLAGSRVPDWAIGAGVHAANAVNLQLDCPITLANLASLGAPIAGSRKRICHWASYTRPGAMAFYRALLRHPDAWPLRKIRNAVPACPAPRWSRLAARPARSCPLP